jgi:2'-hydroxyisoflavone reductase
MRLLVLGGTSFVGRAIVETAIERGHDVTLFSRGRTGADLFGSVERRTGDRDTDDYASLAGGSWDAAIDVSGYVPRHVEAAGAALEANIGRYLFISTISVYASPGEADGSTEDAPRLPPERGTDEVTGATYGPLKVACEDDVTARFGERATIVRPGIVAGPYDPTDRFTYWVRRAARGGRVALPGRSDQPVQVVDAGDLGRLVVTRVEADQPGIYSAVGPAEPTTMAGLIRTCAEAAGTEVEVVEIDPAALRPGLPMVLGGDPSGDGLFRLSGARARAAGLTATPLVQTARDTLTWDRDRGRPDLAVGVSAEREAELLS